MKHEKNSRGALSEFGQLLHDVIQQLVDFPEDVEVNEIICEQMTVFEVSVRQVDHGKVVGRAGANIEAVRVIALCRGGRDQHRYRIELIEDAVEPSQRHVLSTHPSHTQDPVMCTTALLGRIVQSLVDEPDRVTIRPLEGTATAVFEVEVDPADVRKVLGRRGQTADALRRLITSMGCRENRRYLLTIVEPG